MLILRLTAILIVELRVILLIGLRIRLRIRIRLVKRKTPLPPRLYGLILIPLDLILRKTIFLDYLTLSPGKLLKIRSIPRSLRSY